MPPSPRARKVKITVTLSPLEERIRRDLETQTEAYYRSLSLAEQEEDKEWATLAAEGAGQLWEV